MYKLVFITKILKKDFDFDTHRVFLVGKYLHGKLSNTISPHFIYGEDDLILRVIFLIWMVSLKHKESEIIQCIHIILTNEPTFD